MVYNEDAMERLMKKKQASRALLQRVDEYLLLLRRIRHQHDAETIHDFRVASRNLLALLPLFPPRARPGRWKKQVNRRLKALNRMRDLQVLQQGMSDARTGRKLQEEIEDSLGSLLVFDDKVSRRRLKRELRHSGHIAARFIQKHPGDFARGLRDEWFRIHVRLFKRLNEADSRQPRSLHKLRVAYKSFRYLITFMQDAGELAQLDETQVKYWQDMLGDIQDSQFTLAWLAEHRMDDMQTMRGVEEKSLRMRRDFIRRRRGFHRFIEGQVW